MSHMNIRALPLTYRRNSQERFRILEIFTLLVGVFSSFYVNFIGQLYITEIILILLFPFQWIRSWNLLLKDQLTSRILLFGSFWFVSQVFTDLIRSTPTNDMLRGWASILVLLVTFSSLNLILRRSVRRIRIFLLGYAVGALAGLYLQPPYYFSAEPWKFGFGYPITLFVLLFIAYTSDNDLKDLKKWILPLLALGGLSIYWNARSLGAMMILTALILWLRNLNFGKAILTRVSPKNILVGGLILGLAVWGLTSIYAFAAQKGYLGQEAQQKYMWQYGGRFGLLLGGRSEILASAIAVWDSPIIGHGSWAKDPVYRVFLYRLIDLGYELPREVLDRYVNESDLIPAHSHIFQAWVWGGILGAVFWLMILRIILDVFIQSNRFPNTLYIFVIFIAVSSVWDIFFSPFGSAMRLHWAFRLIILITAYYQSKQREQATQPLLVNP